MSKLITVAIIGCGNRGHDTYAQCEKRFPDRMKIVACADIRPERLEMMKSEFGLTDAQCYASAEDLLQADRLADVLFVCTPDHLHYPHAMAALSKDYHLLLEKPISPTAQQCRDIEALAKARNRHVMVCHVLRYTVFYQKVKELIDSGILGEIGCIQANEQVGYWHQAHSFVRGNWRNTAESNPMILAKCCHDMDMMLWLAGKHCKRVTSFGSLKHFKAEYAPAGAPPRCTDGCPAADTCPYNAERYYLGHLAKGNTGWPVCIVASNPTEEKVLEALKTGPYGRCVYHCDNDVVDHQVVNLELEDDLTVSFVMCGLTADGGRDLQVMGTHGELYGQLHKNLITVKPFDQEPYTIDVSELTNDFSGHSGGDARMVEDYLKLLAGEGEPALALTTISQSVESHLVALAAEESRLAHGKVIDL